MPKIDDTELYPYIDYINEFDPVDDAIRRANEAAQTATAASVTANAAAQTANEASETANAAAQTANNAAQEVESAIENFEGGYYPEQTVGMADTLMSGDTETVQFAQRTSNHDGMVSIESLHGNTVKWNQLRTKNDGSDYNDNGVIGTKNNINGFYVISGIATADGSCTLKSIAPSLLPTNHKILIKGCCPPNGSESTFYAGIAGSKTDYGNGGIYTSPGLSNVTTLRLFFKNGAVIPETVLKPQIIDLTIMFGAGNEPATVEEFEALFHEDYYPYDAGSLLPVNIEGITSAGATRNIPMSTYFPDGMRSAGTAFDELDFVNHKAITRIGAVDLGSLNWVAQNTSQSGKYRMKAYITGIKHATSSATISNIKTVPYESITGNQVYGASANGISVASNEDAIYVYDENHNTSDGAAAFKTAMDGVLLYYEVATSTETALPENLQATYPVEIGGTESIVIPTGEQSAPPTFVIAYAYDANGIIDKSQSIIAPVEHGTASDNYVVDSYLVMDGVLYHVTSAIASGETITPDTNCVATTVMNEITRLTA